MKSRRLDAERAAASRKRVVLLGPNASAIGGVSTYINMLEQGFSDGEVSSLGIWPASPSSNHRSFSALAHLVVTSVRLSREVRRGAIIHVMVTSAPSAVARELSLICLAWLFRGMILAHFHGGRFVDHSINSRSYRLMLRLITRLMHKGIVLSNPMQKDLSSCSPGCDSKLIVLSNPVEDSFFGVERREVGSDHPLTVLCMGEIGVRKRQLDVMSIVEDADADVRLMLAGPVEKSLQEQFERDLAASSRTVYLGLLHGPERLSAYSRSDVYCLFSDAEALPISILEAMASAMPVIATDVGSVADMVDARTGHLLAVGDRAGLRQAIVSLAMDREELIRLGEEGRLRVRPFGLGAHVQQLRAVYAGLWNLQS